MSVTSLITRQPLLPKITITKNDASTYVFNPFVPTFDFRVRYLSVQPPFDAVGGKFTLDITSSDGTNSGANTLISNIDEGNEILFEIGKTSSTTKIMRGVIESWEIKEDQKDFMHLRIQGPDWGSDILKHRVVNGQWVQKKNAAGTAVDTTDTTTTIKQIVLDLLQKDQSYPFYLNGSVITAEDQGIVVDTANVAPIDYQIAVFNANMEFLDDKLQELDDLGGAIHYVDPDKNFIMKQVFPSNTALPAEILLVDDNSDSVGTTWVSGNVGLIAPGSTYLRTLEHHKRVLYGVGGENEAVDQSSTDTTSQTQLDTVWIAQSFTPVRNNVSKIVVWLSKVGTPTEDFVLELREDNSNAPTGSVIRSIIKNKSFLDATGTTASPITFEITDDLIAGNSYWIVVRMTGDATNTYRWHHDNTDNNPSSSSTSADDVTWTLTTTPNRFKYAFRHYYSTPVLDVHTPANTILTASSKHFHEDVMRKADITDIAVLRSLLRQTGLTLFKRKDIFKASVYAPDTLLQNGQQIRIRKQASGYTFDANFVLGNLEYVFESTDDQSTGTFYYNTEAARYVDYT